MIKFRFPHKRLSNEPLKNIAEFYIEKMNGNTLYSAYQPQITLLSSWMAPFGTAITNAKLGGTDRTKAKNKIQTDIINALTSLGKRIEVDANELPESEQETFATNTGFELAEARMITAKKVLTFLEIPTGFAATDEKKQGSTSLKWNEMEATLTYLIECLDKDGHWYVIAVSEDPFIVLSGFPSKATQTFRIRAISNGTLMSDCWSL